MKAEPFSGYITDYEPYIKPTRHYTNVSEALTWDIPKEHLWRTTASTSAYVKGSNWIEGKAQREARLKDLLALKKKIEQDCEKIGWRSSDGNVQTMEEKLVKEVDTQILELRWELQAYKGL